MVILYRFKRELRKQIITNEQMLIFFFNINNLTPSEIYENAENLQKYYHNDLASTFANECVYFKSFFINIAK